MKPTSLHQRAFCFCLSALIILSVSGESAFCQTDQNSQPVNSLLKNSWALQFGINSPFAGYLITSFQGGTISLKKHLSKNRALRFGIYLRGEYRDSDSENLSGPTTGSNQDNQTISLNLQYTIYPRVDRKINFYWGVGPIFSFTRSHDTEDHFGASSDITTREKSTHKLFSMGISGMIGAEWFVTKKISLLSEYSSSLLFSESNIKQTTESKANGGNSEIISELTTKQKIVSIGASSVKTGISFYF